MTAAVALKNKRDSGNDICVKGSIPSLIWNQTSSVTVQDKCAQTRLVTMAVFYLCQSGLSYISVHNHNLMSKNAPQKTPKITTQGSKCEKRQRKI